MQSPEITSKSWMMIALLGVTWGTTFLMIELALDGITPAWLAASRIAFATVLMLVVVAIRKQPLFLDDTSPRRWGLLVFVGLLSSAAPFNLLSWGQQYVTSGFAGVSMAAVALMVLPIAHVLLPYEKMTWRRSLGFAIGFVGVCILIGGQAFDSSGSALEYWGRAACLAAAGCYAISSTLMRKLAPMDPVTLATVLMLIGAVAVVPIAYYVEGAPKMPDRATLIWIAILGLVPTAAANVLRVLVVRQSGPVFMSITNYIVPVVSVFAGWLILSEPLPASLFLALILILIGVGLSQFNALRNLFKT